MPCLFGVRPGETTVAEGLRILDKHPLTHGMQTDAAESSAYLLSKEAFIQILSDSGKHVRQITLGAATGCSECSTSASAYQLGFVLAKIVPGNQALYFQPSAN